MCRYSKPILIVCGLISIASIAATYSAHSRAANYPVKYGHVWKSWYAHFDPEQRKEYFQFLNNVYREELETDDKKGLILDYKILVSEPSSPDDWNVEIMLEYPSMATADISPEVWSKAKKESFAHVKGGDPEAQIRKSIPMRKPIATRIATEYVFTD
jgi:hypothetical protein